MRTRAALSIVALLFVTACAGVRAREHALWPTVASTWPAVRADCDLALRADPSAMVTAIVQQVDAAVMADDYGLLRGVNWGAIELLAEQGVVIRIEGGMSEGVAASLRERNTKFSQAMRELTR